MSGAFLRRVLLTADGDRVNATLEDDFHHFTLTLTHDSKAVTAVAAHAVRHPWATCPQASMQLQQLVGCTLATWPQAGVAHIDAYQQCTHQYDLARMAMAQAARGGARAYLGRVDDELHGRRLATLGRDGIACLQWTLEGSAIVAGSALVGSDLRKLNLAQIEDADLAESVMLLRRCVMVAGGRGINFDAYASLEVFAGRMTGACYAFQPQRLAEGTRSKGSVRNLSVSQGG